VIAAGHLRLLLAAACLAAGCGAEPSQGAGSLPAEAPPSFAVTAGPAFELRRTDVQIEGRAVVKALDLDNDPLVPFLNGPLLEWRSGGPDGTLGRTRRCSARIDEDVTLAVLREELRLLARYCRQLVRIEDAGGSVDVRVVFRRSEKFYPPASWPRRLLVVRIGPAEARLTWTLPGRMTENGRFMAEDGPTQRVPRPPDRRAEWPALAKALREACGPPAAACHARVDYLLRGAMGLSTHAELRPALRAARGAMQGDAWRTLSLVLVEDDGLHPSYPYIDPWW
jgi:hypothetical protein